MKRVPIIIQDYPEFYRQVLDIPKPVNGFVSKRKFRKDLKKYFGLDVHQKLSHGARVIFLLPEDVVAFKLKYRESKHTVMAWSNF